MAKMTTTTNDVAMQNMLLLIDNIMPHRTCLKPRDMIFNKGAKSFFFASTHGALTLVNFCTYVELNKNIVIGCPCGSDDI
jgi:phosphoribosylpyrophosphate synthetase